MYLWKEERRDYGNGETFLDIINAEQERQDLITEEEEWAVFLKELDKIDTYQPRNLWM